MTGSKHKIYREIRSYTGITFGLFLYVLAWVAFLIPNGIVGGGATGVATVVYYISGQVIPVSYSFFILNAILLVIGFYVLGNSFGVKTIYGIAFTFVMLAFLPESAYYSADNGANEFIAFVERCCKLVIRVFSP